MTSRRQPSVPVLTDVLQLQRDDEPALPKPMLDTMVAPHPMVEAASRGTSAFEPQSLSPHASTLNEAQLSERILADVQRQIDLMIEHQLGAALSPVLSKLTQDFALAAREAVSQSLREVIERAVKQELDRVRAVT